MRRFSVPVRRFSFSPRPLKAIAEGASKGSLLRRASEYEALRVRLYGSSLADRNVARVDCLAGVWVYRRLLWPLWPSIGTASTLAGFSDVDRRCDDIAQSSHQGSPLPFGGHLGWLAARRLPTCRSCAAECHEYAHVGGAGGRVAHGGLGLVGSMRDPCWRGTRLVLWDGPCSIRRGMSPLV